MIDYTSNNNLFYELSILVAESCDICPYKELLVYGEPCFPEKKFNNIDICNLTDNHIGYIVRNFYRVLSYGIRI